MIAAMRRLFLALWPDDAAREAIVAVRDAAAWPAGATLTAAEDLHVTLHFLGAVPEARVADVADAARVGVTPFELQAGVPTTWHGGIAVLDCGPPGDALAALHRRVGARLEAALADLGWHTDVRPYRPHVTLARKAGGVVWGGGDAASATVPSPAWQVRDLCLAESAGGRYTVLERFT